MMIVGQTSLNQDDVGQIRMPLAEIKNLYARGLNTNGGLGEKAGNRYADSSTTGDPSDSVVFRLKPSRTISWGY